jgi:hypothetical protein
MPTDDEAAQKARAEALHRKIDDLVSGRRQPEHPAPADRAADKETPRDFVHRRMQELETPEPPEPCEDEK